MDFSYYKLNDGVIGPNHLSAELFSQLERAAAQVARATADSASAMTSARSAHTAADSAMTSALSAQTAADDANSRIGRLVEDVTALATSLVEIVDVLGALHKVVEKHLTEHLPPNK